MRANYILLPLLLTACATPQESCISNANRELSIMNRLVNETRGNLARGFAIESRQETFVRRGICDGETEDGVEFEVECEKTDTRARRVPVAIDLNAERAKLESLEERQLQLQQNLSAQIAQCRTQFPET